MKCDYCKIQYDTPDNVCPACGMPARKRWLKVLARILEVFVWCLWIGSLMEVPKVMASGHLAIGFVGSLLMLPATYYLLRKIIKRRHRMILSLLRIVFVIGGLMLVRYAIRPNFEFSEDKAVDYAKAVLLQRYEHDDTFVYGDYAVKKGKIDNERWDYIIPLQIQFCYELENGNGEVMKKEATYVFYWDGMTDTYRDEHWELYEDEKVYWENKETSVFTTEKTKKMLCRAGIIFAGHVFPVIFLMCLVWKKNQVCFPNPNAKWKICGLFVLMLFLLSILYSIAAIFSMLGAILDVALLFLTAWLGTDRFLGYTKKEVLYASAYAGMIYGLIIGLLLIIVEYIDTVSIDFGGFFLYAMLAPYYLAAISLFSYFWITDKKVFGVLLTVVFGAAYNYIMDLGSAGFLKTASPVHLALLFVFGVGSYFLFFYIQFFAGSRAEEESQDKI